MIESPADVLRRLRAMDIAVEYREPDRIILDGPEGSLSAELLAELRDHKPALLAYLRQRERDSRPVVWHLPGVADPDDWGWPADNTQQPAEPTAPQPRVCPMCPSTKWIDTPIHDGQSIRRDCAGCGRLIRFPIWHGRPGVT